VGILDLSANKSDGNTGKFLSFPLKRYGSCSIETNGARVTKMRTT
jgi:hypothetical protein